MWKPIFVVLSQPYIGGHSSECVTARGGEREGTTVWARYGETIWICLNCRQQQRQRQRRRHRMKKNMVSSEMYYMWSHRYWRMCEVEHAGSQFVRALRDALRFLYTPMLSDIRPDTFIRCCRVKSAPENVCKMKINNVSGSNAHATDWYVCVWVIGRHTHKIERRGAAWNAISIL